MKKLFLKILKNIKKFECRRKLRDLISLRTKNKFAIVRTSASNLHAPTFDIHLLTKKIF
jgi:hypothetical protein